MQHDAGHLAPVGSRLGGIEQAEIRDEMLLVVFGQDIIGRRQVGDIWIKWRLLHQHSSEQMKGRMMPAIGADTKARASRAGRIT
ncbi:hypothetical protein ACQR1Y_11735 [Bradyrhizobium sp. HKCCYLRH3099]|uniref:hypothetical protein n=1 Tax=unclassified Bradyrhizobium TaxID=2631580 RepID=UPI003EBBBEFB